MERVGIEDLEKIRQKFSWKISGLVVVYYEDGLYFLSQ